MSKPSTSSWIQVRGGKWHKARSAEPTFVREEQSLCGLTFQPLNVTWREEPPTPPRYLCVNCLKRGD